MENCNYTTTVGNTTICHVNDGGGSSLRHDIFVAAWAVVGTCAAIAAYNYYIDYQVRSLRRKKKEEEDGDSSKKDDAWIEKNYGTMSTMQSTKEENATTPSKRSSLAASLAHVEGMNATGNFLSGVLSQMWNHVNIAVSNTIKDVLEPTLTEMRPVSLHFVRIDLGGVPIRMRNMFIHRVDLTRGIAGKGKKQAGIQIDADVIWDGNCDILLQANMTKSAKFTFGVEKIKLSGRMNILLGPLTTEIPIVSSVQYGFTNPPDLQLSFSGAVSVLNKVDIVQSQLPALIQSSLAGVLVLPQRLVMPMDLASYDFLDTYRPPAGMVRITVAEGRGFQVQRKLVLNDIPDVYCMISLGASEKLKTSTQYDSLNPSWKDEHFDFILYDMDQKIYVDVFDKDNAVDSDDTLGKTEISVRDLFKNGSAIELELESDGYKNGSFIAFSAELFHLSDQLHSLSSPLYDGKNKLSGLVTIIITKAFDIPVPKADAATCVKVVYGEGSDHEKSFYTGTVMDYPGCDALNPMYDCVFHVPITAAMIASGVKRNKDKNSITLTLIDTEGANGSEGHGELGKIMVTHETLRKAYKHTMTKTSPIGNEDAKLEYMIRLSGMQSEEEFTQGANIPRGTPPDSLYGGMEANQGVDIRVTAVRGRGFQIRKRSFVKKDDVPDVYCKICLKDPHKDSPWWKTATIKDDTMPQWNESKEFKNVYSTKSTIVVEVFDENSGGKDSFIGGAELSVEHLLRKRLMEVEIENEAGQTKMYVTLRCIELESFGKRASDHGINAIGSDEAVLVHYHPHLGDEGYESTLLEQTPLQESATPQATTLEYTRSQESPTPQASGTKKPRESLHGKASNDMDVRVTAVRGRGFQVRKRRFKKDDIPDVYLKIRLNSPNKSESSRWKTSTIKDDTAPQWNEDKDFEKVHRGQATIRVDAYEDNMMKDEYIGGANFSVEQLLQKGMMEVELENESTLTKAYVTMKCVEL